MNQKEIEQYAFLYLCGDRDRKLLLGKEEMSFSEFDRLTYLTEYFSLNEYHMELWNRYGGKFEKECEELLENEEQDPRNDWRQEVRLQEQWILEFCKNIPDERIREQLLKGRSEML